MPIGARLSLLAVLSTAIACAAGTPRSGQIGDSDASLARRVLDILEHRHLSHRKLGAATRASVLQATPEADAATLDAIAKRYDPHSAYVTPAELQALRAEMQRDLPEDHIARGRIVEQNDTRVGLVVVPSIYLQHDSRSTSGDVRFIAAQLAAQGASVMLVDLRGNGGGVIEEAVRLAGAFAGAGPVAYAHASDGSEQTLRADDSAPAWRGPLVVWIDAATAGASELFAAAMQDRGRALVIGQRSYGEGTGQTLVLLSSPLGANSGAVRVSDRMFYRLDGKPLQRAGVTPDIEFASPGPEPITERTLPGALPGEDLAPSERASVTRIDPNLVERLRAQLSKPTSAEAAFAISAEYLRVVHGR